MLVEGVGKEKNENEQEYNSPIAVMFVPYTEGAVLAKRYREYEMAMKGPSGWYMQIVERAGDSLVDLLHRSDPWSGEDCKRPTCLQCETKLKTGKKTSRKTAPRESASTRHGVSLVRRGRRVR